MNRLLLPSLFIASLYTPVNALPWSDVVSKTDFGEKYIVKEKTVKVSESPITIRSAKYFLSGKYYRRKAESFINRRKLKSVTFHTEEGTIEHFENEAALFENNYAKYFKPTLEKYNDDYAISYQIKYTPIFQDINGVKSVLKQKDILCPNPKLKDVAAAYHQQANHFHLNNLDRKVCDKYAKF